MSDGARSGVLMLLAGALAAALLLALPARPPPQSQPLRVDVVLFKKAEALPGSEELAAVFPAVAALDPAQRKAVAVALGLTEAPCVPCREPEIRPLSSCALDAPAGCENLPSLVERAAAGAAAGLSGQALQNTVLYGDAWVPAAAGARSAETSGAGGVPVELWIDLGSPGLEGTLATASALTGASLSVHLWLRSAEPVSRRDQLALGAEAQGELLSLAACWLASPGGVEGEPSACAQPLLEAVERAGADEIASGAPARAVAAAQLRGLRSSPTWFVNGYRMRGLQSAAAIQRMIDREAGRPVGESP